MATGKRSIAGQEMRQINTFLFQSFEDYKTARILYNSGFAVPGCFLANTALEKVMKARLIFHRETPPKTHELKKLFKKVVRQDPGFNTKIKMDYLKALTKIYDARYLGDQSPNYSFIIPLKKYLSELDFTYDQLASTIKVTSAPDCRNLYIYTRECELEVVKKNNFILQRFSRKRFVETNESVMEYRIFPDHATSSTVYITNYSKLDGDFSLRSNLSRDGESGFKFVPIG
jgi:HEPN domain-containing protein